MDKVKQEIKTLLGMSEEEVINWEIRMKHLGLDEINKVVSAAGFSEYINGAKFEAVTSHGYRYALRFWDRKREQYRHLNAYFDGVSELQVEFDK